MPIDLHLLLMLLEAIECVCTHKKAKLESSKKASHKGEKRKKHPGTKSMGRVPVGTLPAGYVCNVPLPWVPLPQSTQSHQVDTIPDYYKVLCVVSTYNTPCSLVKSAAYAFSPAW